MDERVAEAVRVLPHYLSQHVLLSACALVLGVLLGLPLAVLAVRYPRLRWPLLTVAALIQTIPGIALLALFYPLLLGLSALVAPLLGKGFPALGFLPSVLALTLYALLPILRNAVAGLSGVNPDVIEAANAVGMTPRQRLLWVEAPLAAPVVMAGIRTAAVWTIGAATLSTVVGQTSLGNYIFSGLQTENWLLVLFGCAAAAVLALVTDQLLGLVEIGATRRNGWTLAAGLAGLAVGTAAALTPLLGSPSGRYVVGAKNFSEQYILAELIAERLEREGATAQLREGLGSAVIFRALASGDIGVYVDYSGTLWTNVMGRRDAPPRAVMLRELSRYLADHDHVEVLGALGFENAYVLAMRRERAKELGVTTIADLAQHAPQLALGSDIEFLSRPEWSALRGAYALDFRSERSYSPTFMYRALAAGDVDVISAFSSDGRIAAQDLLVLADPRHAIPAYDALILVSPRRSADPVLRRALAPLIGAIPVERMREANLMVDRSTDPVVPREAARFLAALVSPEAAGAKPP